MQVGREWVEIAGPGVWFEAQSDAASGIELSYGTDQPAEDLAGLWIPGRRIFRRSEITARAWCRLPATARVTTSTLRIFTGSQS